MPLFKSQYRWEEEVLAKARSLAAGLEGDEGKCFALLRYINSRGGKIVVHRPEFRALYLAAARALLNLNRPREALDAVEGAVPLGPEAAELLLLRGAAFERLQRYSDALTCYERASLVDAGNADAWSARGRLLGTVGRGGEAVMCLHRALETAPERTDILDGLMALEPGDAAYPIAKARALLKRGDFAGAAEVAERAKAAHGGSADLSDIAAEAFVALGRWEDALQSSAKALDYRSDDPAARMFIGIALLGMGRPGEALEHLKAAAAGEPYSARPWYEAGRALDALGRKAEAEASYRKAAALGSVAGACRVASVLEEAGDTAGALEACVGALKTAPGNAALASAAARILARMGGSGRLEAALAHIDRALAAGPGDGGSEELRSLLSTTPVVDLHVTRGSLLLPLGRKEEALAAYERALSLDASSSGALRGRASALRALCRHDDALKAVNAGLALRPGDAVLHIAMGETLHEMGRDADAVRSFESALKAEPGNGEARALLSAIRASESEAVLESHLKRALELECRLGRRARREELFRDAAVPFEYLERVDGLLDIGTEPAVRMPPMGGSAREAMEADALALLKATAPPKDAAKGYALWEVFPALKEWPVAKLRRTLAFINAARAMTWEEVGLTLPLDPLLEELGRRALDFPPEDNEFTALCRKLSVGPFTARRVGAVLEALRGNRAVIQEAQKPPPAAAPPQVPPGTPVALAVLPATDAIPQPASRPRARRVRKPRVQVSMDAEGIAPVHEEAERAEPAPPSRSPVEEPVKEEEEDVVPPEETAEPLPATARSRAGVAEPEHPAAAPESPAWEEGQDGRSLLSGVPFQRRETASTAQTASEARRRGAASGDATAPRVSRHRAGRGKPRWTDTL